MNFYLTLRPPPLGVAECVKPHLCLRVPHLVVSPLSAGCVQVALSIQYKADWTKHIFVSGEDCDVITAERVTAIGKFEHGDAVCRRRSLAPMRDRFRALADGGNVTVETVGADSFQTAGSEPAMPGTIPASEVSPPTKGDSRRPAATSLSLQHVRFNPRAKPTSPSSPSSFGGGMRVHVGGAHVACDACDNGNLSFEGPGGSACQVASQAPCPPSSPTTLPAAYAGMATQPEETTTPGSENSTSRPLPAGTFVSVRRLFFSCRLHQSAHQRRTLWGHTNEGPCGLSPADAESVLKSALHEQAKQFKAADSSSSSQADPEDDAVKWQVRQLWSWLFCVCSLLIGETHFVKRSSGGAAGAA